jgi:hypothetical protein
MHYYWVHSKILQYTLYCTLYLYFGQCYTSTFLRPVCVLVKDGCVSAETCRNNSSTFILVYTSAICVYSFKMAVYQPKHVAIIVLLLYWYCTYQCNMCVLLQDGCVSAETCRNNSSAFILVHTSAISWNKSCHCTANCTEDLKGSSFLKSRSYDSHMWLWK